MERTLTVSFHFLKIYMNASTKAPYCYPNEPSDKDKFTKFIENYLLHGFDVAHFPGRIKASTDVDTNDPQFITKVDFAKEHRLWHYHIGIPCYESVNEATRGDWLSSYILNFQHFSDHYIKLVDLNAHPPFELPKDQHLAGETSLPVSRRHLRVVK